MARSLNRKNGLLASSLRPLHGKGDLTPDTLLFDSAFLAKLEQLFLLSRRIFRGQSRAERKSRKAGASLEFADYRNYARGDDLRNIDWNVYGRLEKLFLKLFEEEEDLHIYILVDASSSMRWTVSDGRPTKFDQARKLAAALAYIGLSNLDRVNVYYFAGGLLGDCGMSRGKGKFHEVLTFLRRTPQQREQTRLSESLRAFGGRTRRRGLVILLSDLFDPRGYEETLRYLRHQKFDLQVVQVLDPAELDPALLGDLLLVDEETQESYEITADERLLGQYRKEVAEFVDGVENFCKARELGYLRAQTDVPFEDLALRVMRESRLVK